jgi:hypothetical protein
MVVRVASPAQGERGFGLVFVGEHDGYGSLRIVEIHATDLGDQFHTLGGLLLRVANVEFKDNPPGVGALVDCRPAEHPEDIPYAELGIRDVIPSS